MASTEQAADADADTLVEKVEMRPREYQIDVMRKALLENTVACLPTGSGKTFIAIMVLKEMAHQLEGGFADGAKRTVFLVPSVALVKQQASEVKEHTDLVVKGYVGSDGVDHWDMDDWRKQFSENQVLVMTVQIMVNILQHGYLVNRCHEGLGCVNLLILDECHHTSKNDPYVQVMSRLQDCELEHRPRILGLSASLVNKSSKSVEKFEADIEELKKKLGSQLTTARDMAEVTKYATTPHIRMAVFDTGSAADEITATLDGLVEFLKNHFMGKLLFRGLKNSIVTLQIIYAELGPWACRTAARSMAKELRRVTNRDPYGVYRLSLSRLRLVALMAKKRSYAAGKLVMPPKLRTLKEQLLGHIEKMGNLPKPKPLVGIIFVDRRYVALALNAVLRQMAKMDTQLGPHIRCNFLTGHGDIDILSKEAVMKCKTQNKIISEFAQQKINVLVATKVAEEGLDIRKCNLVVRFDLLMEFRGYVQSKGRARDKPSSFIVMAPSDKKKDVEGRLERFDIYEQHLIKCCREEHQEEILLYEEEMRAYQAEDEEDEFLFEEMHKVCKPFYPNESKALARADLGNSVQLVYSYLGKLCKDGTQLAPHVSLVESDSDYFPDRVCYQCSVRLPACSALPNINTEGEPMPSRAMAKRAACLEVVRKLHGLDELDNHLRPLPADDFFNEDEFSDDELEQIELPRRQGNQKLKDQAAYPVQVPECFQAPERSARAFHLYSVTVSSDVAELASRYTSGFGIIVARPLAQDDEFKLRHSLGEISVRVSLVDARLRLTPSEVELVSGFTRFFFTHAIDVPSHKGDLAQHLLFTSLHGFAADDADGAAHWHAAVGMTTVPAPDGDAQLDWPGMIYVRDHSDNFGSPWQPAVVEDCILACAGSVVEKDYSSADSPPSAEIGRCEVVEVRSDLSATSVDMKYNPPRTFAKLDVLRGYDRVQYPDLPILEVKRAHLHYDFITCQVVGRQAQRKSLFFIAEHSKLHVFTASQLHAATLLPSVLTRLFHGQQAAELHRALCSDMARQILAEVPHAQTAVSTADNDNPAALTTTGRTAFGSMAGRERSHGLTEVFPGASLVFKSLSRVACRYDVNLERLEMLGDSFLKIATSVFLFCHPKLNERNVMASEGRLTDLRMRMISNSLLYKVSRQRNLVAYMLKECNNVKQKFLPPLCRLTSDSVAAMSSGSSPSAKRACVPSGNDSNPGGSCTFDKSVFVENVLSVKNLADTVEALIGAFLLSGGNDAARHFMVWCGIPHRSLSSRSSLSQTQTPTASPAKSEPRVTPVDNASSARACGTSSTARTCPSERIARLSLSTCPEQSTPNKRVSPARHSPRSSSTSVGPSSRTTSSPLSATTTTRSPGANSLATAPRHAASIPFHPDAQAAATKVNPPAELKRHALTNKYFLQPALPPSPLAVFRTVARDPAPMAFFEGSLRKLQHRIGYEFRDKSWLLQAITHPSYEHLDDQVFVRSYQQLEFIGDAILDYLVVRHVYDNCSASLGPGSLALILHHVTCNRTLAEIAVTKQHALHKFLRYQNVELNRAIKRFVADYYERVGEDADESNEDCSVENFLFADGGGENEGTQGMEWPDLDQDSDSEEDEAAEETAQSPKESDDGSDAEEREKAEIPTPKALGDVVEAIVAAIFVDCGMDLDATWAAVWPIMQNTIEDAVARARSGDLKSPVVQLCEMFPTTCVEFRFKVEGRSARCMCTVKDGDEKREFSAVSDSKRAAKIGAARKAMAVFKTRKDESEEVESMSD